MAPSALTLDERRAALASLTHGLEDTPAGPQLKATGNEVDGAGPDATGTVKRLLIRPASSIGYMTPNGYQRAGAVPGDTVRLTKDQAERLDDLGVTLPANTDLDKLYAGMVDDEVPEAPEGAAVTVLDGADAPKSDEDLAAMKPAELVAYVGQNPDTAERVRALEEARPANKRRKSILDATDPEKLEEARRLAEEAAAALTVGQVLDGEDPGDEGAGDDD